MISPVSPFCTRSSGLAVASGSARTTRIAWFMPAPAGAAGFDVDVVAERKRIDLAEP